MDRARQAGALVMHQMHTVDPVQQAAERGVDIIVGTTAASAALIRVGVEGRMTVPWTSRTVSFIGGGTSITCASALSSGADRHR